MPQPQLPNQMTYTTLPSWAGAWWERRWQLSWVSQCLGRCLIRTYRMSAAQYARALPGACGAGQRSRWAMSHGHAGHCRRTVRPAHLVPLGLDHAATMSALLRTPCNVAGHGAGLLCVPPANHPCPATPTPAYGPLCAPPLSSSRAAADRLTSHLRVAVLDVRVSSKALVTPALYRVPVAAEHSSAGFTSFYCTACMPAWASSRRLASR